MLVIDDLTIVVCAVLAVLTVLSVVCDTFFRKVATHECEAQHNCGSVSVVIISENNAAELERNLSNFLNQEYEPGYEVIVVICKDEDGTKECLKPFKSSKHLYVTFVPASSRYMSTRKLAVTLGVKAAKNDLILLTDATCNPCSAKWISSMTEHYQNSYNMVIGYCNYNNDATHYQLFDRLHQEFSFMLDAIQGTAYAATGQNLLFSKSMFMNGNGFLGNLKYLRGEYAFLVNKYAEKNSVVVNTSKESFLTERSPSRKEWYNTNLFYAETRKHLSRSLKHRFRFNLDMLSFHFALLASLGTAVYALTTKNWIILAFSVLALIVPLIVRLLNAKKVLCAFSVNIPLWKVIPYEFHLVWHNLKYKLRYRFADKYDFICHKS